MRKITNIRFVALEFDFGYYEGDKDTYDNEGNIDAKVFVDITADGEVSEVKHSLQLHDISFSDFMGEEDLNKLSIGEGFSDLIQSLRLAIAYKVSNDLGIELVDKDFIKIEPLRNKVDDIEGALMEMSLINSEQQMQNEQVVLELTNLLGGM